MALVCSPLQPVSTCDLCSQITIAPPVEINSGILITVTATVNNVCIGNRISIGSILCERFVIDGVVSCRTIATKVIERVVTGNGCCTNVTETFTFLVANSCRTGPTALQPCATRTFEAAVEAHYVVNCPCPCDCTTVGITAAEDNVEIGTVVEE